MRNQFKCRNPSTKADDKLMLKVKQIFFSNIENKFVCKNCYYNLNNLCEDICNFYLNIKFPKAAPVNVVAASTPPFSSSSKISSI